jgi:hypothetical protein
MNDDDMLAAMRSSLTSVKDSLTEVHMDQPPEAIIARARGRQLRRSLPGIGAGGLALGIGLALALSGGRPVASGVPLPRPAVPQPRGRSTSTWPLGRSIQRRPAWST